MKTRKTLFLLKASKGESLAEDEKKKRQNNLRTKEDIGKGERDKEIERERSHIRHYI